MTDLLKEIEDKLCLITLNRTSKHNAFDDHLLLELQSILDEASQNKQLRAIVLKANGKHFSAGADLEWMQRMASFSEEENLKDAMVLAKVMNSLHSCPIPTIAMVQGAAFGGGAGLTAACNIAIAADSARFCFSEVKLGLIPAVISPYVIKAIGERSAKALFMSAETFDASRAKELGLVQHCVSEDHLLEFTLNYAHNLSKLAPMAVHDSKCLVDKVAGQTINEALMEQTAKWIAQKRVSEEGQRGLNAFLNKETPNWS